jgi:hypothetical protein
MFPSFNSASNLFSVLNAAVSFVYVKFDDDLARFASLATFATTGALGVLFAYYRK